MDRVLLPLGFEAMQVRDFFMFLSNTVCERLFCTMDVTLGTNYFEHQQSFLDLFHFSRPSQWLWLVFRFKQVKIIIYSLQVSSHGTPCKPHQGIHGVCSISWDLGGVLSNNCSLVRSSMKVSLRLGCWTLKWQVHWTNTMKYCINKSFTSTLWSGSPPCNMPHCPSCGQGSFNSHKAIARHMGQPRSGCSSWLNNLVNIHEDLLGRSHDGHNSSHYIHLRWTWSLRQGQPMGQQQQGNVWWDPGGFPIQSNQVFSRCCTDVCQQVHFSWLIWCRWIQFVQVLKYLLSFCFQRWLATGFMASSLSLEHGHNQCFFVTRF